MRSSNASRRNRGRNTNGRRNGVGINQIFESNGNDSKVKGNAQQVNEKYQLLARDAKSSGDVIKAENYFQHAEHYHRLHSSLLNAAQANGNNFNREKEEKQKNVVAIKEEEIDQKKSIASSQPTIKNSIQTNHIKKIQERNK